MYNKKHPIEITKSGLTAMWEKGGSFTNTGSVTIIADHNGYPKRPVCVRTRGDLACGNHALIPIRTGDVVVSVDRHHDKVAITVERIVSILDDGAVVEPCNDLICVDAIQAAIEKANDYHCRQPYYIIQNYKN